VPAEREGAAVRTARHPTWRPTVNAKERPMPPANQPPPSDKRREEIHRAQLSLVQASLRAGVQYTRPGRVGKASPKRA
jgi:hypothetical protein